MKLPTLEEVIKKNDRLNYLMKNVPRCEECDSEQVQLTHYKSSPARWKCRKCNHQFISEPLTELDSVMYEFATIEYDYHIHPDAAKRIINLFEILYNRKTYEDER